MDSELVPNQAIVDVREWAKRYTQRMNWSALSYEHEDKESVRFELVKSKLKNSEQ